MPKQPQPTERLDAPRAAEPAEEKKSAKSHRPTSTPPAGNRWRDLPVDAEGGARLLALVDASDAQALMDFAFEGDRFLEFSLMPGVAEPVQHHPEGDVGSHMRLVMKRAFELTADLPAPRKRRARLAALCHDLGKVVTGGLRPLPKPDGRWLPFDASDPHHPGHDHLGIELSRSLFDRLKWPEADWEFVAQFALYHQAVHQLCDRNGQFNRGSATLARNLVATPKGARWGLPPLRLALREADWAADFALAAQSDAQGRLLPPDQMAYPQADFLRLVAKRSSASSRSFAETPAEEIGDPFILASGVGLREAFAEWMKATPQVAAHAEGFKPPKAPRPSVPDPRKIPRAR